jgi:D-alanyl-D-alanine carboxypeptidase/D-alanyl-D-alanine-endopeptidase (penicillin-binding protein 4)
MDKWIRNLTILIVISFTFGKCVLANTNDAAVVQQQASRIIDSSGLKKNDLGLLITEQNGEVLYSLNAQKHFIPASITKLVTTAAVMSNLEPDFKFHTLLYVDGSLKEGVLKGNLYLKGGGDPGFVSEKMWMLVNDFLRENIKTVTGNIIVDDSYFDDERFDKGREADRNDRAYDAPVGALSFNWNSTTIYIRPGEAKGDPAKVFIDPENKYIQLENKTLTTSSSTDLTAERVDGKDHDVIVVSGKIALNAPEHHIYKNISDPALYAGYCLKRFLHQREVEVSGVVGRGQVPASARLVGDQKSESLGALIKDMNKFSNNFVAEMLAKNLGAYKTSGQGHMKDGVEQVRNFLREKLKWSNEDFNIVNVSGFTLKNSFTPTQFVSLLSWIQKQFSIYPEILSSLPIAGIDGTLEKRMKGTEAVRWVRAKTGLLNGVVALSGYAGRPNGLRFFTFMYNGRGKETEARAAFDALAASLVR